MIHSEIKRAGLDLKRFTALHARRRGSPGFPHDIRIVGSQQMDSSITIAYGLVYLSPESGMPKVVPPQRKATLKREGGSWRLITHDILTTGVDIAPREPSQ